MAWINALISDVDAHRIYNRLTARRRAQAADCPAGACGPDGRTITADQRKVDLLTRLLLDHFGLSDRADGDASGSGRRRPRQRRRWQSRYRALRRRRRSRRRRSRGRSDQPGNDPEASGRSSTGPVPVATRPDISVVVSLATLLGLANDSADARPGADSRRHRTRAGSGRQVALVDHRSFDRAGDCDQFPHVRTFCGARQADPCPRAQLPHARMRPTGQRLRPRPHQPVARRPGFDARKSRSVVPRHHNLKTHHGYQLTSLTPPPEPETQQEREQGQGTGTGSMGRTDGVVPDSPTAGRWRWRFPSGLTHTDSPDPPSAAGPDPHSHERDDTHHARIFVRQDVAVLHHPATEVGRSEADRDRTGCIPPGRGRMGNVSRHCGSASAPRCAPPHRTDSCGYGTRGPDRTGSARSTPPPSRPAVPSGRDRRRRERPLISMALPHDPYCTVRRVTTASAGTGSSAAGSVVGIAIGAGDPSTRTSK